MSIYEVSYIYSFIRYIIKYMCTLTFLIHEFFVKKKTQIFNILWEIILLISTINAEKMELFPRISKKYEKKIDCPTMDLRYF